MTTGQRISEKRKELGLSQESLGEKLGVSRQSIYKWESDSSLPDIDKLIALSRLFGVPVGWLLGVEEDVPSPAAEETTREDWTRWQQEIVEETLRRYHAAQPKPQKSAWDKWSVRILFAICGLILGAVFSVNGKIDSLDRKYRTLESSVDQVYSDTWIELDNMSDELAQRLESVLKSQSELAVDYDCQIKSFDLAKETITFSLTIVPKTHIDGMRVYFQANSGGIFVDTEARQVASQTFSGELTCPLTDDISVSAIFQSGDTRQMQLLNQYADLYTGSLPDYHINDTAINGGGSYQADGTFRMDEQYVYFGVSDDLSQYKTDLGIVEIESVDVGLFLNRKLIHWLEPCARPTGFKGASPNGHETWDAFFHDGFTFFHSPQTDDLTVEEGDTIHFAARITDSSGRVTICCSKTRSVMRNGQLLTLENQFKPEFFDPMQYQF